MTQNSKELKWLYDMGFALHWLHKRSKRPIGFTWQQGPRKTWDELKASYKPDQNVGVRTGEPSRLTDGTYLTIFDVDVKSQDPKDRDEAYKLLSTFLGKKLDTFPIVKSGRGGPSLHVYAKTKSPAQSQNLFRSKKQVKVFMPSVTPSEKEIAELSKIEIKKGMRLRPAYEIDIYGTGKQAAMPPSIHPDSGKAYKWRNMPANIKDIPLIAADKIKKQKKVETKFNGFVDVDLEEKNISERFINLIQNLEGLEDYGSDRSAALMAVMNVLVIANLTDDEIVSVLMNPEHAISEVAEDRGKGSEAAAINWLLPQIAKARASDNKSEAFKDSENVDLTDTDWLNFDDKDFMKKQNQEAYDELGGWETELDKTQNKQIKINLKNAALYMKHGAKCEEWLGYNLFTEQAEFTGSPPWARKGETYAGRGVYDDDVIAAKMFLSKQFKHEPSTNLMHEVFNHAAQKRAFHPVRDWIKSLTWDGEARLDGWLTRYMGAKDTELTRAIGRKMFIGMVSRVFRPGCKFDAVVILEGLQDMGKSYGLNIIAQPWYCDSLGDVTNKDVIMQLQGSVLVEIPELDSMDRASTNALKAFITKQRDKARLAFERKAKVYPRQCILVGTTNDDEYLKDITGNRRFWPVVLTGKIDLQMLEFDRDQLWAEAYQMFLENKEPLYMHTRSLKQALKNVHNDKMIKDPWCEEVEEWVRSEFKPGDFIKVKTKQIWTQITGRPAGAMTSRDSWRLGSTLRSCDFKKVKGRHGIFWSKRISDENEE